MVDSQPLPPPARKKAGGPQDRAPVPGCSSGGQKQLTYRTIHTGLLEKGFSEGRESELIRAGFPPRLDYFGHVILQHALCKYVGVVPTKYSLGTTVSHSNTTMPANVSQRTSLGMCRNSGVTTSTLSSRHPQQGRQDRAQRTCSGQLLGSCALLDICAGPGFVLCEGGGKRVCKLPANSNLQCISE